MVAAIAPDYELYAATPAELDAARHELEHATSAFHRQFGTRIPRIAVVVFETRREMQACSVVGLRTRGLTTVLFLNLQPAAPARVARRPTDGVQSLVSLARWTERLTSRSSPRFDEGRDLAHAACHGYLVAYADQRLRQRRRPRPESRGATYGHPSLPDWMSEGVAALCEREDMQSARLQELARSLARLIPLPQLFAMAYPHWARLRAGAPPSGTAVDTASQIFSCQALSVVRFLTSQGGDRSIGRIVDALVDDVGLEDAIGMTRRLPTSLLALDIAWQDWMERSISPAAVTTENTETTENDLSPIFRADWRTVRRSLHSL